MAQIPTGNFGYALPEIRKSREVSTVVRDNSAGQVAEEITGAALGLSARFREQADLESRKKKAQAATKTMEYETKLQAKAQEYDKLHTEGGIKSDEILSKYKEDVAALREEYSSIGDNLDEQGRSEYLATLDSIEVNRNESVQNFALNATKSDLQKSLIEAGQAFRAGNLGNAVAAEAYVNGEFGAELDRAFGADAPRIKREMVEQANTDAVTVAITNAGEDTGKLSNVLNQLEGEDAVKRFDPDFLLKQRASISSTINSLNERAAYKAEVAQNKRERAAEVATKRFQMHTESGGVANMEMIQELDKVTAGTSYQGLTSDYVKRQDEIQGLLNSPDAVQNQWLAETKAAISNTGSTPEQTKFIDSMEESIKKRQKTRADNPIEASQIENGEKPTVIDWTADADADSVANRKAERELASKRYGKDVGILKAQEVDDITQRLTDASPDEAMSIFKNISSSLADDPKAYNSAMGQISKKTSVYALAGRFAADGKEREAITLLEGKKAIDDKQVTLPPQDKFAKKISTNYGVTLAHNPAAAKAAIDGAMTYYAGLAANKNLSSADIDLEIMKEAERAIIGRQVSLGWGMTKVIAPPDVEPVVFKDAVLKGFARTAADYGGRLDVDELQFINTTNGRFQLYNGREPLLDASGSPMYVSPIYD